jgi:hypothetical protein
MLNRTMYLLALGLAAGFLLATPDPSLAQSGGCDWCVTPTDCGKVDQHADADCDDSGDWCSSSGICVIIETLNMDEERGLGELPSTVAWFDITTESGTLPFALIEDETLVSWDCQGRVLAIRHGDPRTGETRPTPFGLAESKTLRYQAVRERLLEAP